MTTPPTSPILQEYRYYLDHLPEMVERYEGKVVVIKDRQVIGTFDRELPAIAETKKHHIPGTFLVHRVRREEEPWILSRVFFEPPATN